jgi:hypothetical protein
MGEYTESYTGCRVATFSSNPDPFIDALVEDTPESRRTTEFMGILCCAEESKKDIRMPFAIGDDLLYMRPEIFYVETFGLPHSPTLIINIDHAISGHDEKNLGDMVLLHYINKDATGDPHQYSPFIIYTPLENRFVSANSLPRCFHSDKILDAESAEAKQQKEIFGKIALAHPLGKIITSLYESPTMLDSYKPAILQYAGEQIDKNKELQEQLAKITGPETFDPKYPPGPYWETEDRRDELVRKTISALKMMKA